MLQISTDTICYILIKAREFDVKVEVEEPQPGSNPSDEDMREVLQDFAGDATYEEVKTAIDDLNEDEQIELVALTWLGRGDFDVKEWPEAVRAAREAHNDYTAGYLLGIPLLSDYLEEGLSQFGHSCAELEKAHL